MFRWKQVFRLDDCPERLAAANPARYTRYPRSRNNDLIGIIEVELVTWPNDIYLQQAILFWPIYSGNFEVVLPLVLLKDLFHKTSVKDLAGSVLER
jgi:hypothetical protein